MNGIVVFALKQRLMMMSLMVLLFGAGIISFLRLNIEAYPDPIPPLVEIITQNSGQSAEEIERYITIPIEIQMAGLPHVSAVRAVSLLGLSDVRVHFSYDINYEQAEQLVINRLSQLAPLPNGVAPQISPESATGEIYRYRIEGPPGYSVMDLKTIQDWILERRFKALPGVAGVAGWGGKTKAYEVAVDQDKLLRNGVTIPQVLQALSNANINIGGQTVNFGPQAAVVRGVSLLHSMEDIGNTTLSANNGSTIRIKDVASVQVGYQPRVGVAGQDNDNDIAQGIVLMRPGAQSLPTIRRVDAEVNKINKTGILPPGVRLEKIYDRSELIAITARTVLRNLIFGIVLVFAVQWLFLGDLRSAIVIAATIPFALSFAVILMTMCGESANLVSIGTMDLGLIVGATVIMVENIIRHLAQRREERFAHSPLQHGVHWQSGLRGKSAIVAGSAVEVNKAILFSAVIIIAGVVPLFTLSGVEGHFFGPMARMYAYATAGGLIATFTITPALSSLLLPDRQRETEPIIMRGLRRIYQPVLEFMLANRIVAMGGAAALVILSVVAARPIGTEFLPKLEEGNLWIRASLPPTISLEEAEGYANSMRHIIRTFPEVETVVSQLGRPDDGTETAGFSNIELNVMLKPFDSWPSGIDKEKLTEGINAALRWPFSGIDFNFSQNIEDNVEEAASGVKGQNSIKLFGNDLEALQGTAYKIKSVLETVPGMTDLSVFDAFGQPTVNIEIDRSAAARYGLAPGDINSTIQAAIGGKAAGHLYEYGSDRNFPIVVRLVPQYRQSLDAIRQIPISARDPNGNGIVPVPLSDTATVNLTPGYSFIYRENQERYIPIKFSVRGRDLGSAVLEAQQKISNQVHLPAGARLEWVGEFADLRDAIQRLEVLMPIALILMVILLFANFSSILDTLLAVSTIPLALIGGIFALRITGTPFSVAAAMGFIPLFGLSVMEGILILTYFNQMIDGGFERFAAIWRACQIRLRPVMMTCVAACVGLLPAAVSTGIGSQVQKPLALVVVGGMLLAPFLILIILPVLIYAFSRRGLAVNQASEAEREPQRAE
jgi:heavy metal efflux system protein